MRDSTHDPDYSYVRNANGAPTSVTREAGLNQYYVYDALDRLTSELWVDSGGVLLYGFYYNYDECSNRYFKYDTKGTTTGFKIFYYSYDKRNFLTQEKNQ
jgi:YD repeat-containing protein